MIWSGVLGAGYLGSPSQIWTVRNMTPGSSVLPGVEQQSRPQRGSKGLPRPWADRSRGSRGFRIAPARRTPVSCLGSHGLLSCLLLERVAGLSFGNTDLDLLYGPDWHPGTRGRALVDHSGFGQRILRGMGYDGSGFSGQLGRTENAAASFGVSPITPGTAATRALFTTV